jgi:hypothetical protein
MSVVYNTTAPESTLKKSNAIACHCVREAVAEKEILITKESNDSNLSDLMTKALLPGEERRERLVREVLYDICCHCAAQLCQV